MSFSLRSSIHFINTMLRIVIDEEALVRAMKIGKIARVGLDVFENEPEVHPYLMQSERATLFPVSLVDFLLKYLN